MPIPRKGKGLEHRALPPSRRKRRGVSRPGRAVISTLGGGAEPFLSAGARDGKGPSQCWVLVLLLDIGRLWSSLGLLMKDP